MRTYGFHTHARIRLINMIYLFFWIYVIPPQSVAGANILYVAPFPSVSHYQMMEPLMLSLAQRGHQITVLSHYPQRTPVSNYRDVSLRGTVAIYQLNFTSWGFFEDMRDLFSIGSAQCESVVSSSVVQDFLSEDLRFDLLFLEMLDSDCYLGFVKKYSAPYVVCSSTPFLSWIGDWIYQPSESNHVPDPFCRLGGKMDFFGRLRNVLCQTAYRAANLFYNTRASVDIVRKHFRVDIDTLEDVKKNVSMIFLNSFHGFGPARALLPNVVELGGIHIREGKPLPRKIDKFLNESRDGAIVFSMGSMVRADTLDAEVRDCFVTAFGRFPRVGILWKWERELEERPKNVMLVPWIPQSDALGHENVKLFISHGGIHGLMEAVYHGVPVLGIPLYGDQMTNVKNLESAGAAIYLDFHKLDPEVLTSAINEILTNGRYLENAKRLSRIMRDRPLAPLDLGIYWTEHILRNGPPQMATGHLSWYEYLLLDLFVASAISCVSIFFIVRLPLKFLRTICNL